MAPLFQEELYGLQEDLQGCQIRNSGLRMKMNGDQDWTNGTIYAEAMPLHLSYSKKTSQSFWLGMGSQPSARHMQKQRVDIIS